MTLQFTSSPRHTIGVELELQLLDPTTLDLTPAAPRLFARLGEDEHIKHELFQSMVEINTGICANAAEARRDLDVALARLREACDAEGVALASAGSHPFARWRERLVYPADRYATLIDRNRWIARRLMIFGLHVHIGMKDGPAAMRAINGLLHYMPQLLALSASSPYWQGADTGLASSRITIFEALPTAGHPCVFADWAEFEAFYDSMLAARAITSIKDIWWDLRPHPDYGTIELRICDGLPTLCETLALVALVHALIPWIESEQRAGRLLAPPSYWVLRENKWRASRWGLDASFVRDEGGESRDFREELPELLAGLEPIAAEQGAAGELAGLRLIMARPSYERQRAVFARDGSLEAVARSLEMEFQEDRPERA